MNIAIPFIIGFVLNIVAAPLASGADSEPSPKIKVMLLTGRCAKYHNWQVSSVVLRRLLNEAGIFDVETVISPPAGADLSGFSPDFSDYQVVVLDYDDDDWPEATRRAFETFIRNGGGMVSFHATDNAFPNWQAFNEMIGVGGWRGRNESAGSKVRWQDGKMVLDDSPGTATHPPRHDFQIVTRAPDHPVMKGLPEKWMQANDELYSQLRGPAKNLQVLATARADKSEFESATGENEPMLMAIRYGKGRIFHTTLGHVGPQDDESVASLASVGFITTFQRGTEWAATGKVTLPVPKDFPTADKISLRRQ